MTNYSFYHTETKKDGQGQVDYSDAAAGFKAVYVRDDNETSRFDLPQDVNLNDFKRWLASVSQRGCASVKITGSRGNYEVAA